jgi:hypothetical protein
MDDITVEMIARRWCQLAQRNPDEMLGTMHEGQPTNVAPIPYWQIVANDIVPMFAWCRLFIEVNRMNDDGNQPKQQTSIVLPEH